MTYYVIFMCYERREDTAKLQGATTGCEPRHHTEISKIEHFRDLFGMRGYM
jgi:hypothetical protein